MDLEKRIRELEWQVTQLTHDLIHDPLTGLKTRLYFEEQIGSYTKLLLRGGENGLDNLSIIFFDIDRFKKVNDAHGHAAGDMVLQKVSDAIRSKLRGTDTVARWGGEEIVAALLNATEADAAIKAEEIRSEVERLIFPNLEDLKVTISAGVAQFGKGEIKELVRCADQALYAAKNSGRNQVVQYSMLPNA